MSEEILTPETHPAAPDAAKAEFTKELEDMAETANEQHKRDQAFEKYAGYGPQYQEANDERAASAKIKVDEFGPVTIIASINVDPQTGTTIDGHDYNPEAQSHKDIEQAWQKYLLETPEAERFVVFEGDSESFPDRDTAIRLRTEAGMMMFFADESGVERVSGEPTDLLVATELEKAGIAREETALLFTLRSLATHQSDDPIGDMKYDFYPHMESVGFEGLPVYSEEEKKVFAKLVNGEFTDQSPEAIAKRAEINQEIFEKVSPFVEAWNKSLNEYGLPQLVVTESQEIVFEEPVSRGRVASSANPAGQGKHSEIMARTTEVRDRHILDTIADAARAGKKPFVVYGGSHVVSLGPVLAEYYGNVQSS
ncbi:MAG: hypothetical protein WCP56_01095 [Candidatus Saccharibacteria bacterium]